MEIKEQKIERLKKQKVLYGQCRKKEDFIKKQYDVEMVNVIEQELKELENDK